MARPDKVATVQELSARFSDAEAVVLTEYRGLSVADLKALRRSLGNDADYTVTKNTLTQLAAKDAGIEGLDGHLVGPTAIAFINGDVAGVAKGLRDFSNANPFLVLKGGFMDGRVLNADEVTKLANLESREVLLAKMAGAMKGALTNAVSLFAAPISQAARAMGALQSAAEANPDLIGGAGTPSATESESAAQDRPADAGVPDQPASTDADATESVAGDESASESAESETTE